MKLQRNAKIIGTIIVHELGEVFHFSAVKGCVTLRGEIRLSDRKHEIAAHIIARGLGTLVIWQDMCGRKHFVKPEDELNETSLLCDSLDPRDVLPVNTGLYN